MPGISWNSSVASSAHSQDKFFELFISEGLYQHVLEPTRYSNTLDLVFTNEPCLAKNIEIHPSLGLSDHNMVSFNLGIIPPSTPSNHPVRCWEKGDLIGLSMSLDVTNWPILFNSCTTVDDMWIVFRNHCIELIDEFVPIRTVSHFRKKFKYNNKIKRLLLKKRKMFSKMKLNRSSENVLEYKNCSKACNKEITMFKRNSEMNLLKNPTGKKFYKHVNSKLKSSAKISCLIDNGKVISDDADCADIFNDQFASVFTDDDGKLPDLSSRCNNIIEDFVISRKAIVDCIKQLKPNSSPGPDALPSKFFKHFCHQLSNPLQLIFKRSFDSGKLPSEWKVATVVPIFKHKGKSTDAKNFRPISLTCICCKIMERLVKDVIYSHLVSNSAITNHQHGFVSRKSTQTQLLECTNMWSLWLDKKKV